MHWPDNFEARGGNNIMFRERGWYNATTSGGMAQNALAASSGHIIQHCREERCWLTLATFRSRPPTPGEAYLLLLGS